MTPAPPPRVLVVAGTRSEAIKVASPIWGLREHGRLVPVICATGQHVRPLLDTLETLDVPPDVVLPALSDDGGLAGRLGRLVDALAAVIQRCLPAATLVQGDTTSALAGALASFYARVPVAHIEAGLRTDQRHTPWPEEAHRRIITSLASLHYAPTDEARQNLEGERISTECTVVTGNTAIDALHVMLERLGPCEESARPMVLVVLHRREHLVGPAIGMFRAIASLARRYPAMEFLCLMHENPQVAQVARAALENDHPPNLLLRPACPYPEFVGLLARSRLIMTDSGGIQDEAPALGKPLLVLEDTTARAEAIRAGSARLVGTRPDTIRSGFAAVFEDAQAMAEMAVKRQIYGDGRAGERIARHLAQRVLGR